MNVHSSPSKSLSLAFGRNVLLARLHKFGSVDSIVREFHDVVRKLCWQAGLSCQYNVGGNVVKLNTTNGAIGRSQEKCELKAGKQNKYLLYCSFTTLSSSPVPLEVRTNLHRGGRPTLFPTHEHQGGDISVSAESCKSAERDPKRRKKRLTIVETAFFACYKHG